MMNSREVVRTDVVITAGGTREPIDDVRFISNVSSGKFGYELAKAYSQQGYRVVLLAPALTMHLYGELPDVEHIRFTSASDLHNVLHSVTEAKLVLHSAAVSDFTPIGRVNGKISSDQDELVIRLKRTPKILAGLREHFGDDTRIVGFKLLSGVPVEELVDVARAQIEKNGTDLCIANDLKHIRDERIIHIVRPDGNYSTLTGSAVDLARGIARAINPESNRTSARSIA